ncbi:MAG: glycosyltransferase family 1 protein [Syntrophomonas sp.]
MFKILILNTIGLDFEGITKSIISYLEATDRSDMEIDFALVSQNFNPAMLKIIEKMGCNIHVLPLRMKKTFRYFFALRRLIQENGYDIVHAHGNSATLAIEMWAAKLAGCKVRIAHSRNTSTNYPILNQLLKPLFYMSYTQGFACGTEAGRWLFGNNDFKVIPNGKDISKFSYNSNKRIEYRTKLKVTDKVVIGHAGNFNYQKNHEYLIRIFKELACEDKHYVLYLMGEGSLRPQIKKMVEEYELEEQVFFTGSIDNMADMLQAMDIMVFPSIFEGLPNVVLEWQVTCLPCVISDSITKECKLTDLVSYMSLQDGPAAWAEKIRSIEIVDREEIKDRVLEQIRTAGFDIEENAKQLKEIYYELLLNKGCDLQNYENDKPYHIYQQ